jgi:hypothetical protein
MDLGVINTTLTTVASVVNKIKDDVTNYYTTKSLTEATKLTRVEPLTIISKDLINLEYMPDVAQSLLSIFCGYYLQAVSMLTKVSDVEVVRILDKLNPDRDETGFLLTEQTSRESIKNLVLENYIHSLPTHSSIAVEGTDEDNIKFINEVNNLSVGKLLNVVICYDKSAKGPWNNDDFKEERKEGNVSIPVSVRLLASVIPNATISHLLAYKKDDNSLVERFHSWRGGRISFIKDLIFCQDLIDEHKRALIGDETGTMQEIMRRVNNSKKFGLLTKNPSLVSASNLFVISEEIARELESKLGGKLSNPKIRNKAFENTYAMIIAVVDREWERVTFYSRGISASTDVSIKELKTASKGKGMDITDILKSFSMGSQPSF